MEEEAGCIPRGIEPSKDEMKDTRKKEKNARKDCRKAAEREV